MSEKKHRLGILLALLVTSVVVLFQDPVDHILTEIYWTKVGPRSESICPRSRPSATRWTLVFAGQPTETLRSMRMWTEKALGSECSDDCAMEATTTVTVDEIQWPGFFDGAGQMTSSLTVERRGAECHGVEHFVLKVLVDQGRRGSRKRFLQQVGRILGMGLLEHWTKNMDRPLSPTAKAPP